MNRDRGRPPHDDVLTPMEWTTVEWVRHGLTNRQIAARRGVSLDAVKFHVGNVLGKLGLSSRAELRLWNGVARGTALARRGPASPLPPKHAPFIVMKSCGREATVLACYYL